MDDKRTSDFLQTSNPKMHWQKSKESVDLSDCCDNLTDMALLCRLVNSYRMHDRIMVNIQIDSQSESRMICLVWKNDWLCFECFYITTSMLFNIDQDNSELIFAIDSMIRVEYRDVFSQFHIDQRSHNTSNFIGLSFNLCIWSNTFWLSIECFCTSK